MSVPIKRIVLHGQVPGLPFGDVTFTSRAQRVFLLSPAHAGGKRAAMLFRSSANFALAHRLRMSGLALGEAFSFMSPLYFRGKLLYASTFANAPEGVPSSLVITPSRGLLNPETVVGREELAEICDEPVHMENPKYRDPLERDLASLSETLGSRVRVVLLGSIATPKYLPILREKLGERLVVPRRFVGLGNMSRGALLLRCSREGCELEYIPAAQAI